MNILGFVATFLALVAAIFAIVGVSGTCKGWAGAGPLDYGTTGATVCFGGVCGCTTYDTTGVSGSALSFINGARTALAFDIFAMLVLIGATIVFGVVAAGMMASLKIVGVALAACGAVFTLISWAVFVGTLNSAANGASFTLEYAWILTLIAFVLSIAAAITGFLASGDATAK